MARYERVNTQPDDEPHTPVDERPLAAHPVYPIPNSPPPSFEEAVGATRRDPPATNTTQNVRNNRVNDDLADAFDADSDDEADDTQRLVRSGSQLANAGNGEGSSARPSQAGSSNSGSQARPAGQRPTTGRVYGGGMARDGVFSNLSAKPEVGDPEKEDLPPSYEQAAADMAPPYWETTILAPGLGGPDDVYIDGMPVGSFFSFIWNGMISMAFQLVGFLLTYLLHSTHAAKNGSRAGLGITLIQYGFYMKTPPPGSDAGGYGSRLEGGYAAPPDPNAHEFEPEDVNGGGNEGGDFTSGDWAAYILMIVGWFILIRAVTDYVRVRRHEQLVLQSPDRGLGIPIIATGERPERVV